MRYRYFLRAAITSTPRFTHVDDHFAYTVAIQGAAGENQQMYPAVRFGDCDDNLPDPATAPPAKL
ncbi:MAG TPA: hypothetical protein VNN25_28180 [Thermoanaerobaculia bacterium]|nr:hypothetical protein [Thermoanaerobaculia bacterium]